MKTAYELAMERLGSGREYSEEQKRALADIDQRYDAKVAESRIAFEEHLAKAEGDEEAKLRDELKTDLARLERKRESEKDKVRGETG